MQGKIDALTDELAGMEVLLKEAEETAKQNRDENMTSLTEVISDEQKKVVEYISKIESETLMSKTTPHKEALTELTRL